MFHTCLLPISSVHNTIVLQGSNIASDSKPKLWLMVISLEDYIKKTCKREENNKKRRRKEKNSLNHYDDALPLSLYNLKPFVQRERTLQAFRSTLYYSYILSNRVVFCLVRNQNTCYVIFISEFKHFYCLTHWC